MEPKINLIYNSQSAEGIAGFGWNLSAYSVISRQGKRQFYDGTSTPVNYSNNNDAFLLDGQHLFPISGYNGNNATVYGTENESFSKIESFTANALYGPDWFTVTTKEGIILEYGTDISSKVLTDNGQFVMFWLLKKVTDKSGNYQEYKYSISQTDRDFALGKLIKQTDATNNVHTIFYDAFGRLTSKTGPAGTTSFTYYSAPGKANDNIISITGFAGDTKTYQYDNLQRLTSESTKVDGTTFTKSFEYDALGNLTKTTYPSGVSIKDTYNSNGILTETSMTYNGTTQPLFNAIAMNSRGVYTGYNYGNGKSSTVTYDLLKGVPTKYAKGGIQDLSFNFDANTGNLMGRKDGIKGINETFTYDNLNRLTGASINSVQQFAMTYDDNSGNSLGNIQTKSDIGNYSYDAQRINAVRFITTNSGVLTNPPNIISVNTQAITYTPFLKTATVNENGYQVAYTYGQDEQRIKSVLTQGATTLETKYYMGVYERQTKGAVTREIHYVNAGNGLCAIIVKENGVVTPYFVYSDHLGSLLTITDKYGTVVAEQNFDAWGRNRNPANWTYSGIPTKPDWLYRGFTGHEHLTQFALINMNGRMYDPVTCRMLSPDNFIQQPFNTQNYNRYSYGINNPLKYKDPTGDFFIIDDFVIGFVQGLFSKGNVFQKIGMPLVPAQIKPGIVQKSGVVCLQVILNK